MYLPTVSFRVLPSYVLWAYFITYKSNVMHAEDNVLNLYPIRQKINAYPRKENNFGDDSSVFLLDDEHLGDTIIAGNIYLSGNIIT